MLDWTPILLTFKLAILTTFILVFISIPIARWLAYTKNWSRPIIEAMVSMPLVLPPTVIGFYLLLAFSPANWFGGFLENVIGLKLVFSFPGLVIASLVYSLPFMVQPLQAGFAQLSPSLSEASYSLGKSEFKTLVQVLLPNMKSAILTGIILSFAHTIGEFGVVLMIGGNIPGVTKVASIAIYDEVESLNYVGANWYSAILFSITFIILLFVYSMKKGSFKKFGF